MHGIDPRQAPSWRAPSPGKAAVSRDRSAQPGGRAGCGTGWVLEIGTVERRRLLAGLTREKLASSAHIDAKTLRDALSGRRKPTLATAQCIARALELSLADVIVIVEQHPHSDAPRAVRWEQLELGL
jgi:DNA-binding XRE family transcriptional regulator